MSFVVVEFTVIRSMSQILMMSRMVLLSDTVTTERDATQENG
jgi:hypothetical protein